jgi:hypothetical protein
MLEKIELWRRVNHEKIGKAHHVLFFFPVRGDCSTFLLPATGPWPEPTKYHDALLATGRRQGINGAYALGTAGC